MKENDYNLLSEQLRENKADKFHTLLVHQRETLLTEEEIAQSLQINQNAFYTLKSRLYNRIQEFLASKVEGPKIDLLRNVANIPNLLFNSPRATALAILDKLEKDLIDYDMPYELTDVYNALKKLHIHSPKYYEYTQLYNKHVAYTIALDKAEDLLAKYNKTLGEYYISRDKASLELCGLAKKEIANICRLYKSHHLTVYQNIINISTALFLPLPEATEDDEPIEDILTATENIFKSYSKDATYQYLYNVFNFLSFEYYHNLKLHKKATQYFDILNDSTASFMLYNFCCFPTKFLISKVERYIAFKEEEKLYKESQQLNTEYEADIMDIPNYINYKKYLAIGAFYSGKYNEAESLLNEILNEVSFKNIAHSEVEIKLFLALCYSMLNK